MTKSNLSKSVRKHIASEKARMRLKGLSKEEVRQKIAEWIKARTEKSAGAKVVTDKPAKTAGKKSAKVEVKNKTKKPREAGQKQEKVAPVLNKKSEPKAKAKKSEAKSKDKK